MDKSWKVIKVGNVLTVRGDYFDPPAKAGPLVHPGE